MDKRYWDHLGDVRSINSWTPFQIYWKPGLEGHNLHFKKSCRWLWYILKFENYCLRGPTPSAGVPNFLNLMSNDLRWSWDNNTRNKVHNKCSVLQSLWNYHPPSTPQKSVVHETSPWCQKNVGHCCHSVYFSFFHLDGQYSISSTLSSLLAQMHMIYSYS